MRLSIDHNIESVAHTKRSAPDSAVPDLGFLTGNTAAALQSFFDTVDRIVADNPVAAARLLELAGKARSASLTPAETEELQSLKVQAHAPGSRGRRGHRVLSEAQAVSDAGRDPAQGQSSFNRRLVQCWWSTAHRVREVLERDQEFTVEPYGVEMTKVMSPLHNGGFSTFVLSTDDNAAYEPDKRLLSVVCNRGDAERITDLIHQECVRRVGAAVAAARTSGSLTIDVVRAVARYVPVTLGHEYLGVPVARRPGSFELTPMTC